MFVFIVNQSAAKVCLILASTQSASVKADTIQFPQAPRGSPVFVTFWGPEEGVEKF